MRLVEHADRATEEAAERRRLSEIRSVNEQLLIAGLRAQTLADELRHQLAFTAAISASLGEGVYAVDQTGRVTFANPAAERLLGWTQAELLGRNAHQLLHTQCARDVELPAGGCPLLDVIHAGVIYRNPDDMFRRRDGAMLPVAYSSAPVVEDGRIVGSVVAFSDETDRHARERQREEFIEAAAHDLRSPLTVIKGTAQFLLGHNSFTAASDGARLQRGLERIAVTATQMNALVQDFLDLGQLRLGQQLELDRHFTDLVALTRRVVDAHVEALGEEVIRVSSATPRLMGVWDAPRLERVLGNLLSNAVKYSPQGAPVHLTLCAETDEHGDWAMLRVQDWGMGIPAADLPHIFERFRRGGNVIGRVMGTGIGLESARHIVAQHGGAIEIASQEGSGTTVTVRLPVARLGPEDPAL